MSEQDWKISKPAHQCSVCGAPFVTGGVYFSALWTLPEGFRRADFCEACFQSKRPTDAYYFWKTTPHKEGASKKPRPLVDLDNVLEFFKRLEGDAAPQRIAFRYILALMLSRKKMLSAGEKKKDEQGRIVQNYREKSAELGTVVHAVVEPELSEDEIQGLSSELGILLGIAPTTEPSAVPTTGVAATSDATVKNPTK